MKIPFVPIAFLKHLWRKLAVFDSIEVARAEHQGDVIEIYGERGWVTIHHLNPSKSIDRRISDRTIFKAAIFAAASRYPLIPLKKAVAFAPGLIPFLESIGRGLAAAKPQ